MPATNLLPWSRPVKHPVVSGMVIDISDLGRGFVFMERLGDAYGDHSYSSRHPILPPRLSVWVCVGGGWWVGMGVCMRLCTLWLVAVVSWSACAAALGARTGFFVLMQVLKRLQLRTVWSCKT